jgi:hypothetical protein
MRESFSAPGSITEMPKHVIVFVLATLDGLHVEPL